FFIFQSFCIHFLFVCVPSSITFLFFTRYSNSVLFFIFPGGFLPLFVYFCFYIGGVPRRCTFFNFLLRNYYVGLVFLYFNPFAFIYYLLACHYQLHFYFLQDILIVYSFLFFTSVFC